jgi:hypothetical protein
MSRPDSRQAVSDALRSPSVGAIGDGHECNSCRARKEYPGTTGISPDYPVVGQLWQRPNDMDAIQQLTALVKG